MTSGSVFLVLVQQSDGTARWMWPTPRLQESVSGFHMAFSEIGSPGSAVLAATGARLARTPGLPREAGGKVPARDGPAGTAAGDAPGGPSRSVLCAPRREVPAGVGTGPATLSGAACNESGFTAGEGSHEQEEIPAAAHQRHSRTAWPRDLPDLVPVRSSLHYQEAPDGALLCGGPGRGPLPSCHHRAGSSASLSARPVRGDVREPGPSAAHDVSPIPEPLRRRAPGVFTMGTLQPEKIRNEDKV